MRALVTGGTGFVGGAIVRELRKRGYQVRVLARPTSRTADLEKQGIEIARGDVLDRASIVRALAGCGILYHAAAIYEFHVPNSEQLMRTEIDGTRNAMEAALAAGVEKAVYTSTSACNGERRGQVGNEATPHRGYYLSPYEEAKHRAERVVREYLDHLRVAILRPAAVLGPGDLKPTGASIVNLLNGRFPALFAGVLTFVHVGDVARGHVLAAEQERWGETYCLAAQILSTSEFYGMVAELGGVRKPRMVPQWIGGLFAGFEEWKSRRTGRPPLLSRASFRTTAHGFRADGSKAERELGLVYTPIKESLRQAIQWYWDQGLLDRRPVCANGD